MAEMTRGIEIVKQQGNNSFSVTVGGERISTQGKALEVHLEKRQAYVYLVIDCSGSMAGYKLDQARQGAIDFAADALRNGYRVGLIGFDTNATHVCEPASDIQVLVPGVRAMKVGGSTNLAEAVRMGHDCLRRLEGARVMVIATDGQPDNPLAALKAARLAKDEGIEFITIGTDDANRRFLERLATRKELGAKVAPDMFARAIASASTLLPPPKRSGGR